MKFELTQRGIAIPAGALSAQEFTKLKKRLTVSSMGFGDRLLTMQCFHIDKKKRIMYVARMRGLIELAKLGYEVTMNIPEGDVLPDHDEIDLKLKDYQIPIVNFLKNRVYSDTALDLGMTAAYLDLQPGKGKTFIIMSLIEYFGVRSLIVVPGKELVVQTLTTLRAMFPTLTIGEYWSKTKTDGDIVVMTTKSAASVEEYTFKCNGKKQTLTAEAYFARFGFAAFDEAHTYCTKEQQSIFQRVGARYTFACSGTTNEREDKMDEVAYMHVGAPIMGAKLMAAVIAKLDAGPEWKFTATCLKYNGPNQFTESLTSSEGTVSCAKMVSQFSKDPYRSQWLVERVKKHVAEGHQVFVMLDRTELCKLAWDYLRTAFSAEELAMTPGAQAAAMVTGKVKDSVRAKARQSRVVVGTYSCIGTGISWDEFSALVCWHPRKNKFRQFLNRIFRENGDRERERVADFLQDNATSIKSQYYGFRKVCIAERKTDPEIIKRDWTDIQVSDDVQKISDEFIKWDAAQQLAREVKGDKPVRVIDSDFDSDDEGLD